MILTFQIIISRLLLICDDIYLEETVLFNERIINMITKSMGDIMVLYPIITIIINRLVLKGFCAL